MYIERFPKIEEKIEAGKVLVIYGARQVGKSFMVKKYLERLSAVTPNERLIFFNGEDVNVQAIFSSMNLKTLHEAVGDASLLIIDEAQVIKNIGTSLKLLVDTKRDLKIMVTGSSSFELSGQIGEPLVGRMKIINLYPLWEREIKDAGLDDYITGLDHALRFGRYPAVFLEPIIEKKKEMITNIVNGYLLKDILAFDKLKNSKLILDLLKLLAYQVGNEVSIHELATKLSINRNTVSRYLDLLEQGFIIFPLSAFSKNQRNEIRKKGKYYFYDLGIRNALIENFDSIDTRGDIGAIWENFLITERLKLNRYTDPYRSIYFWRKLSGAEVDFVEVHAGHIDGYEFSVKEKSGKKSRVSWQGAYADATWTNIHKGNYKDFIYN